MTSVNRSDRLISSISVNAPDATLGAPQVPEYYHRNGMYLAGIEGVALTPVTHGERAYLTRYGTIGENGRITFDNDHQPTTEPVIDLDAECGFVVAEPEYWLPAEQGFCDRFNINMEHGFDQDWGLGGNARRPHRNTGVAITTPPVSVWQPISTAPVKTSSSPTTTRKAGSSPSTETTGPTTPSWHIATPDTDHGQDWGLDR